MEIKINDTQKLSDIQDKFHSEYPFLKLEFFSKQHNISDLSKKQYMLDHDVTLAVCRNKHTDGVIQINPLQKVWQLEQAFQDHDLPAQVFRLMGSAWIETTQTDWLTLEEQNTKGRDFSLGLDSDHKYLNIEDYNSNER